MSLTVVRFCETDEFEVLPCNWLQDGGFALYPPYGRSKLEKVIKTQENPNTCTWKMYEVKLMTKSMYNTFALASAKASKACLTSDISDKDTDLPSKRPHKKGRISSDDNNSDTDDGSSESLTELPMCPSIQKHSAKGGTELSGSSFHVPPSSAGTSNTCFVDSSRIAYGTPKTSLFRPEIINGNNGSDPFQKQVISYLVKINKIMKDHAIELFTIKSSIETNSIILQSLQKEKTGLENEGTEKCDIFKKLPINAKFEEVESALLNKESYNYFVVSLARLGGNNLQQCIKRFMQKILTEPIMEGYSMHGHKGKKSFGKTKIFEAVVDAIQKLDKTVTNKEIELKTGIFLAKCKERQKSMTKNAMGSVEGVGD